MPRFFFDIDDGERIRDTEGYELPDLNAVRALAHRAAGELVAHELQKTGASRVRVDVRNENGERILSALGHGAVVIAAPADALDAIGAGGEGGAPSPLDRTTRPTIGSRLASDEDGRASLRHLVSMLLDEIRRRVARSLGAAQHKKMKVKKEEDRVSKFPPSER
ncbi:hypothetical protein J2X36_001437 [Methylobacterium sp. BE186]|uniref:DUF6894 family protein n=1 Tax=Methylobacterium sp. BE186 TaxID=2817715 RepID=UPI0028587656|nr:hypothetical protein [Methylobacterium sp. BE186]MDR7036696.1 hypothetical protein [Methylobacterium sp. BE186]